MPEGLHTRCYVAVVLQMLPFGCVETPHNRYARPAAVADLVLKVGPSPLDNPSVLLLPKYPLDSRRPS